jgi:hypothetical protein
MTLDELLAAAAAADGMTRIDFRDPIAAFGEAAIRRLEPWMGDVRLARFAVLTIERAAAEPSARAAAIAAFRRARATCAESAGEEIQAALSRLGREGRGYSTQARTASGVPAKLIPVPPALRSLVSEWRAARSPAQAAILWPRDLWLTDLPQHAEMFRSLPTLLSRGDVRSICSGAANDATAAERALVAVMVWGQGNVGYGRYRTNEILSTPNAPERLLKVARTLAGDGPVAAYRRLAAMNDCGLSRLGPAFGTKFLHFCQPAGQTLTALILDRLVSDWLEEDAGLDLKSQPWSERRYEAYLRQMHAWANELECAPDEVEQCIFQAKADESGSQWSTDRYAAPHRSGLKSVARSAVAEALVPNAEVALLELKFHQAMLDIYWLAGRATGYWAGYFLRSVRKDGGLEAARKLLWMNGTSNGFKRLKKEGRLDLSMETLLLRPEFDDLFSAEERARAADRLTANGYQPNRSP